MEFLYETMMFMRHALYCAVVISGAGSLVVALAYAIDRIEHPRKYSRRGF